MRTTRRRRDGETEAAAPEAAEEAVRMRVIRCGQRPGGHEVRMHRVRRGSRAADALMGAAVILACRNCGGAQWVAFA